MYSPGTKIPCVKCGGSGKWGYRQDRPCFACDGRGFKFASAAPEQVSVGDSVDKIVKAFDTARKNDIKIPRLRLGNYIFTRAEDGSANPGAIYVKMTSQSYKSGEEPRNLYLGKIFEGRFAPRRECTPKMTAEILTLIADPFASAVAYGQRTRACAICGIMLTNPVSIARKIGPICAGKYGFAEMFAADEIDAAAEEIQIPDDLPVIEV